MIASRIGGTMEQRLCGCRDVPSNPSLHKAVSMIPAPVEAAIRSRISSGVLLPATKDPMLTIITSRISLTRGMVTKIAPATRVATRTRTLDMVTKTTTAKTKIDLQTPAPCRRQRAGCKSPPVQGLRRLLPATRQAGQIRLTSAGHFSQGSIRAVTRIERITLDVSADRSRRIRPALRMSRKKRRILATKSRSHNTMMRTIIAGRRKIASRMIHGTMAKWTPISSRRLQWLRRSILGSDVLANLAPRISYSNTFFLNAGGAVASDTGNSSQASNSSNAGNSSQAGDSSHPVLYVKFVSSGVRIMPSASSSLVTGSHVAQIQKSM